MKEGLEELKNAIKNIAIVMNVAEEESEKGTLEHQNFKAIHDSLFLALVLIKKEMPKPPELKVREEFKALGKCYYCAECGVMFISDPPDLTRYCGNCGQRLRGD